MGDGLADRRLPQRLPRRSADEDPLLFIKLLVTGVAILILLLGALGLLNISLVTVRHRIREIGIRRSFGATAGRVFFAVMMESVVATVVAGVVGVAHRGADREEPVGDRLRRVRASRTCRRSRSRRRSSASASATAVGALAGLLPALVAVRVKVIDAIRY